jgi:hypothetical protein
VLVVAIFALLAGLTVAVSLFRPTSVRNNWPIPVDHRIAFSAHRLLGTVFDRVGASPTAVAMQWFKAAAHAKSTDEIEQAARGLATAAERATEDDRLEDRFCTLVAHGQVPAQFAVVQRAGLQCDSDRFTVAHVPDGSPIDYRTRPPTAGAHYPTAFPRYGVLEEPVASGYWVHNLEHGAIVLLYNCPEDCPDLVAQLQAFYASLPANHNLRTGQARLLAVPYADMDHRIAAIGWWRLLELDAFDDYQIRDFYQKHVDRGPECWDLSCPE